MCHIHIIAADPIRWQAEIEPLTEKRMSVISVKSRNSAISSLESQIMRLRYFSTYYCGINLIGISLE